MKYQVKCMHTDKVLFEAFSQFECGEWMEYEQLGMGDAWIDQVISCRGCGDYNGEEQHDAHGISTGYWCHECYESSKYPYRKDRYETIETHGYGERLSDDY
jgi:hypothetical protein